MKACQLDSHHAKLHVSHQAKVVKSKSKVAGKTATSAAAGPARLAQLSSAKGSYCSVGPDCFPQFTGALKRQFDREVAAAGHSASLIDPESLEISVGIETDLAMNMMDVTINPVQSDKKPIEKPWTRTLIDLDKYRARNRDPRTETIWVSEPA